MTDWQPIETVPEGVVDIWVRHISGRGRRVPECRATIVGGIREWVGTEYGRCATYKDELKATHWMPLPAAPE